MKAFFDTSVLVPVFYGDHVHHALSITRFVSFTKNDACCGAHTLVEVYSALTRMPGRHRISSDQAILFIRDIRARLSIVALDEGEYATFLEEAAAGGIVGGAIYDALLASCARKSAADVIYTWNTKHYAQCGPDVTQRLQIP